MSDAAGSLSLPTAPRRRAVRLPAETAAWVLLAALAIATALIMTARGLGFDWASALRPVAACGGLLAGTLVYRTVRPDERIATCLAVVAQLLAATAIIETLSYTVATFDRPICDGMLSALDKALGLDWRAYLDFVAARPWLAAVYGVAYKSLVVQVIAAAAVLGLAGRRSEARSFVLAFTIAAAVSVAISGLVPANTEFVHLGLRGVDFPALDMSAAYTPVPPFELLRAGAMRVISLTDSEGIISFPSFHAALGVIFIVAFWPLRWLRWPALVLNLLLVASTPVNGGHYFVDVIAGALIAVAAVALSGRLEARFGGAAASDATPDQPWVGKKSTTP